MIKITKELKDQVLTLKFSGSIEENTHFEAEVGPCPKEVHVYTKEVSRINSVGVKSWIRFFQDLTNKGTQIKFFECSTAIVEQLNLISNFNAGGVIESVFIPYSCTSCKNEMIALQKVSTLKAEYSKNGSISLPEFKCPKCSGKALFDDIEEEYFAFLERTT